MARRRYLDLAKGDVLNAAYHLIIDLLCDPEAVDRDEAHEFLKEYERRVYSFYHGWDIPYEPKERRESRPARIRTLDDAFPETARRRHEHAGRAHTEPDADGKFMQWRVYEAVKRLWRDGKGIKQAAAFAEVAKQFSMSPRNVREWYTEARQRFPIAKK
ncbi:MAG: hypothetical protein KAY32_13490 [Candidatus Eisenbacteria sp.]|nr:hypothetical protein [Candidatus Eisenbacteria bacterium]